MTIPNQLTNDAIIAASTLIESLRDDVIKSKVELATLSSKLAVVEQQSERITKIVVEGNGQRALTTRVFSLEDSIITVKEEIKQSSDNLTKIVHKVEEEVNEIQDDQKVKSNAVAERGWDIFKQLVPLAIVGLVTLATTGFFASNFQENNHQIAKDKVEIERNDKRIDDLENN